MAIAITFVISAIALIQPGLLPVNSVILAIGLMIAMCLLRMPVAIALIASAMVGAINSGMTTNEAIGAINDNLAAGAQVGMTYVMIGAFAVALGRSGLLDVFANKTLGAVSGGASHKTIKWMLFSLFIGASIMSQNM
ncbi:hypothetical protein LRP52_29500 [Photobacterium sp. ZSDE20]|uniref:Putative Na+/H+ antiporter N-terminal domain-containing protein n=1 Tax=Photobacterium pectinilyticum TaxID=2906793 RepID=A0ABT1N6V3_9GAMM|nr:hypothetical protein [Photobacterium sp. ZSDE20]MCQ1059817.1 hypothetical protein [Photobacterium sp. ZSDE20]MDD1826317.1 hypothetical protein [Photobacterium sp. ZSDE20]